MATQQSMTALETQYDAQQLDLQELVKDATWKDILTELIESNKVDPWNIDLVKIVDTYVAVVKRMKVLDLHIPANIILAASVLLRLKSETINIFPIEPEPIEELQTGPRQIPEVTPLVPRLRLQPNRRITLSELMQALDSAMKIKEKREYIEHELATPIEFMINKEDIDIKAEDIYSIVEASRDKTGLTTFAQLAKKFNGPKNILLDLFVPLLFLAHKRRIVMEQEAFFNEIFVKLADGENA